MQNNLNTTIDKRLIILLVCFLGYGSLVEAQSPGGVGTTNLEVWLRADLGITSSGGNVSIWDDQSTNAYSYSQGSVTSQPDLISNFLNYNPTVHFTNTNDDLETSSTVNLDNFGNYTIIAATQLESTGGFKTMIHGPGSTSHPLLVSNGVLGSYGSGFNSSTYSLDTEPHLLTLNGSGGSGTFDIDGLSGGSSFTTVNTTVQFVGNNNIGNQAWGHICDFIVYNDVLTATEQKQVESYLAIKYGITLDNSLAGTSGDYLASDGTTTIWDASVTPVYHNDVIGISRDDDSELLQKQSHQEDDSLRIYVSTLATTNSANTGTFSSDAEFVAIGHNASVLISEGSTEYPTGLGIFSRIEREWKITNTNFNGTFSLDIKLNTLPLVPSDLRILVDDDGSFTNATLHNPTITVSGNIVTISGISTTEIPSNTTRYLTIVSMNSTTPLPVELLDFNTIFLNNNRVKLNWRTASEINNDFFTIERSTDGIDWEELAIVDGAGNSSTLLTYQTIDSNPFSGTSYYRLKQTDFDGKFEYSEIRSVNIKEFGDTQVHIYPNPAENLITIVGSLNELEDVTIYNTLGQNVTLLAQQIEKNETQLTIDLSKLNSGSYYIKTRTTANKVYKQ